MSESTDQRLQRFLSDRVTPPSCALALSCDVTLLSRRSQKKIDPGAKDNFGATVLHYAALGGNLPTLRFYLEEDVASGWKDGVSVTDHMGHTVAHYAARSGNADVLSLCIKHKANIAAQNKNGVTVTQCAALSGDKETFQMCISNGGQIDALVPHHIAWSGNLEMLKSAINPEDLKALDKDRRSVLHYAAEGGSIDCVDYCRQNGVDLNSLGPAGETVVHAAARGGNVDLLRWLRESYSVDLKVKDNEGTSALHAAVRSGNLPCIKFLVEQEGLHLQDRDNFGNSSHGLAVTYGQLEVLKYCVARSPFPPEERRLAHAAIGSGDPEICDIVLGHLGAENFFGECDQQGGTYPIHACDSTDSLLWCIRTAGPEVLDKAVVETGHTWAHLAVHRELHKEESTELSECLKIVAKMRPDALIGIPAKDGNTVVQLMSQSTNPVLKSLAASLTSKPVSL